MLLDVELHKPNELPRLNEPFFAFSKEYFSDDANSSNETMIIGIRKEDFIKMVDVDNFYCIKDSEFELSVLCWSYVPSNLGYVLSNLYN